MNNEKQRVTVHLPQDLWEALVKAADAAECFVADYAEQLLEAALAELRDEHTDERGV